MSLTIVSTQVPTGDAPICDVMLEPYIVIKEGDGPGTRCHVPDEGCLESTSRFRLRSRWFRAMIHRGSAVCNVHPDREAAIQCLLCLRAHAPVPLSFHCGPECLKEHWHLHRDNYHLRHYQNGGIENGYTSNGSSYRNSSNHEEWVEVGRTRCYVPTVDDVGCVLKFECSIADTHRPYYQDTGGLCAASITARVRPAPQPPVRAIIPLRHLAVPTPAKLLHEGRFTVLTYNILADLYATGDMYGTYCPAWALSWHYRRQNIIKELACYQADVVCLQEVQSDHYEDHVREAMEELGYIGVFKKKTTEVFIGRALAIDGCATFYRKDRFALIKKYEVEFNKAAMSTANHFPEPQRNAALNRLSKDNVALIVVLESVAPMAARQKQLICVANTHIHSNPEHSDVKLWQVHTLLKGLEKIAASAEIPIIVAGDFNSEPGSAAHTLMVTGSIDKTHPETAHDPAQFLQTLLPVQHKLSLRSAYSAVFAGSAKDPAVQQQAMRMDPRTHEPLFTNFRRDYGGTLDYIFFTPTLLTPTALLELPSEDEVLRGTSMNGGLPNARYSSDHISLMAEFQLIIPFQSE